MIAEMVTIAVVKLGKKGSLIKAYGNVYRIPCEKVAVYDTIGAGDMYAAGVLYALAMGLPLDQAGMIGSFAAGQIVQVMGARLPYSIKGKVEALASI